MESSAMRHQFIRAVACAAALLAFSVSAFAQSGQLRLDIGAVTAASQAAAAQPTASLRRLTIDEAVKAALEQNLGIRIQRVDPQIQDLGIVQSRSFWAPNLSSSLSRQGQTQQATSAL